MNKRVIGIALIVAAAGILIFGFVTLRGPDELTQQHGHEFEAALNAHYAAIYAQEYPALNTFSKGKVHYLRVIVYQPECSIIEAQYEYYGITDWTSYYLLRMVDGVWKVVENSPSTKMVRDAFPEHNEKLPVPFSCDKPKSVLPKKLLMFGKIEFSTLKTNIEEQGGSYRQSGLSASARRVFAHDERADRTGEQ